LFVNISRSPSGKIREGKSFNVTAAIYNREDVDYTVATNVQARLVLPPGFTVTSGNNPINLGTAARFAPATVTWTLNAPNDPGVYDFDIEVWSDNLGVAVDDPDNPYHKFRVRVVNWFGCSR
jgi:hypothetical protein